MNTKHSPPRHAELEQLLSRMFQAHPWHGISPGDPTGMLNVYVEIVPTDPVKYDFALFGEGIEVKSLGRARH